MCLECTWKSLGYNSKYCYVALRDLWCGSGGRSQMILKSHLKPELENHHTLNHDIQLLQKNVAMEFLPMELKTKGLWENLLRYITFMQTPFGYNLPSDIHKKYLLPDVFGVQFKLFRRLDFIQAYCAQNKKLPKTSEYPDQ